MTDTQRITSFFSAKIFGGTFVGMNSTQALAYVFVEADCMFDYVVVVTTMSCCSMPGCLKHPSDHKTSRGICLVYCLDCSFLLFDVQVIEGFRPNNKVLERDIPVETLSYS